MIEETSRRRMAENEVVFREHNEAIEKAFTTLTAMAKEDGEEPMAARNDTPLYFYCECADENCRERVLVAPSVYNKIHTARDRFVIVCGHEVPKIEKVIEKNDSFCVVEKFITPPQSATKLRSTEADNSSK